MIGRPDWAEDATLDNVVARTERSDELNPVIREWAADQTTADIVELASLLRIPCIEVGNGETIPQMDHFASEPFYDVNPDGGFLQPAPPFRMHPPIPGVAVVPARRPSGRRSRPSSGRPRRAASSPSARGRHPAVRGRARRRLHVVLGRPVLRPHARHVRRRRHPRRVDGAARRRPADEPPPADDGAVVGALAVLPRHEHEQARRHDRHVRRRGPGAGPAADRRVRRDGRELQPAGDGVVRAVVGRGPGDQPRRSSWCGCRRSGWPVRGATAPGSP